ncbi:MAG: flagellar motor protein MotB [Sedimentisphaerales bacterium]|nr:flagellar motor protein MotB [Sedimentisphaerales bacterium]
MKKGPPQEEKGETAPIWIISFADMISLLMAFFIMLLTMATAKSGKLCNDGYRFEQTLVGFRRTISSCGLPGLLGNPDDSLYFNHPLTTYNVSDGESNSPNRTFDAEKERIQRIFNELDKMSQTLPSQLQGRRPQFSVTPISFEQKQSLLDEPAKRFLTGFANDLQRMRSLEGLTIYAVGLAPPKTNSKQQWVLTAQRARSVADFIKASLPAGSKVSVCSWGCGNPDDLAYAGAAASQQTSILLGTLQTDSQ